MAVRKTANKTSKKASSNFEINLNKKTKSKAEKVVKKSGTKALALALVFLVLGVALGAGVGWVICRNDCFTLLGQEEVSIELGEKYIEDGVKIVAFGFEASDDFSIETNLKISESGIYFADEVGTYYIKYHSNHFKYDKLFKVEKVRLVHVVEASEGGE